MSDLVRVVKGDESIFVHPTCLAAHQRLGWSVAADQTKADEPAGEDGKIVLGTDSGDQFSDDELRSTIEAVTGKAPHPNAKRETLVEKFNALNAVAPANAD